MEGSTDTTLTIPTRKTIANSFFEAPFVPIDNLIFDNDDRLYISSVNRGTILEVLLEESGSTTNYRTVVSANFTLPSGVAELDSVVYSVNPNGVFGYDAETAEEVLFYEPVIGVGELESPFTVVAWPEKKLLLQLSLLSSTLILWNPATQTAELVIELEAPATDAHPFQDDQLIVLELTGDIVLLSGAAFENKQVIANIPGALFLTGDDSDVYASIVTDGTVVQFIADGTVLDDSETVSMGHDEPEGIALAEDGLLVVATGSGTLEHVDLESGEVKVIATGLDFQPPIPQVLPFGWMNDVAIYGDYAFVNGDGANVIYKIGLSKEEEGSPTVETDSSEGRSLSRLLSTFSLLLFALTVIGF